MAASLVYWFFALVDFFLDKSPASVAVASATAIAVGILVLAS